MEKLVTALSPYLQDLDPNTLTIISIVVSAVGVLLSLVVALMGVWFAVAQYRLKRSIKINTSVTFSQNIYYTDTYPAQIILQNLKDKSEAIFGIHIQLSNNTYITLEDLEDSPLVIQPFETIVRNYKPLSFYGCNGHKVDINRLIKTRRKIVVVLTTNKGKYVTKQRKHCWSPILASLNNDAIAALQSERLSITFPNKYEYTVPSDAKFIIKYVQDGKPIANFIYKEKLRFKDNPKVFEFTLESLASKRTIQKHIADLHESLQSHKIDLESLDITAVDEMPEYKRLESFYTKSTKLDANSWLVVNVLGKVDTFYRRHKMKQGNHDRYSKSFTYNEKLVTKWVLVLAFGALITVVLGHQAMDWLG
ncbi:hypothetical protein [Vibrio sp. 10N.247.311.51]|uniref:hypothetical protein n=1 Tax=Vibrio sp. 10N.247.311.51 TaxID=3229996 RepID=UPI003550020F